MLDDTVSSLFSAVCDFLHFILLLLSSSSCEALKCEKRETFDVMGGRDRLKLEANRNSEIYFLFLNTKSKKNFQVRMLHIRLGFCLFAASDGGGPGCRAGMTD